MERRRAPAPPGRPRRERNPPGPAGVRGAGPLPEAVCSSGRGEAAGGRSCHSPTEGSTSRRRSAPGDGHVREGPDHLQGSGRPFEGTRSMDASLIVIVVVVTALVFDFTNGFHDTANAMATSIATGAFRPRTAVAIAACLNVAGAFLSVQVANTISGGLVDETLINPVVIFAGLVGAILWNLVTWFLGLPSSSSHALFGGLIGATWVAGGLDAIHLNAVLNKVIARAEPGIASRGFKLGQTVTASMVALAHGTNDAQKTMGVITLTLITAGMLPAGSAPPFWVVLSAGLAIALGTYMGGWRIIRTLGRRVSDIQLVQGFSAETTSTAVILTSTHLGLPLSTTQVCTGSILG